jgi:hypothetical protein
MLLRLPVRDADISALAERLVETIRSATGSQNQPPVSVDAIEAGLTLFKNALSDYEAKKAVATDAALTKNQARLACLTQLRQLRDWVEASFGPDDPMREQVGLTEAFPGNSSAAELTVADASPVPIELA